MDQNVIAIIWDFDKTLIDGYMQKPIFEAYHVDENAFWQEVNSLPMEYRKQGIRVNRDTIYLNHFITCVQQGIFPGLNNARLREFGSRLNFYPGVPEIFRELEEAVSKNEKYKPFNIAVEHYIVSTGLAEVIRGSIVNDYVRGIWGCEFIEKPIKSALEIREYEKDAEPCESVISQIAYAIDNTSKTRAIFEINKGSNLFEEIDVNSRIAPENRRVPFENMIYIADGPSDVPAFSVIKSNGGKTFAVYPKGDQEAFKQVNQLIADGRIDMLGEADYSKDTTTYLWLKNQVLCIADRIYEKKREQISKSASKAPRHL
ncbi:MAG TPA: haloacid dehalogenase-like hydrolase [Thermoclostridium caenicola]|uniref:Haloacid dehalogenase-like hydrolase n=1 Tax=Thermoclostridium caenicola TaxID=659425 RepID=A0A1M6JDD0_9FIRM|nr:haloacid dehalogenase-like hydrolase [Thermoclostridium caenicola]SHJ44736.1 hypothetical protein SAMN05444373_105523 [Thermoclostridium caenicola]HOK42380.1 haloacid dehalogenase-like hydrolase [Thermoclostridium caenicola]